MAKADEYYQEPEDILFSIENIKLDRGVGKNAIEKFFKEFSRGKYYYAALWAQTAMAIGNRNNVQIMNNMAVALAKDGEAKNGKPAQIENAGEIYENALKIDPENAVIWINFGNLLLRRAHSKEGRYEDLGKARKAYESAIKCMKNFKNADIWYYMGVACEESGKNEDALQYYRTADAFNRKYIPVQFRLVALLYKEAGKLAKQSPLFADVIVKEALEIIGRNQKLERYRKMFEKMEKELNDKISKRLQKLYKETEGLEFTDLSEAAQARRKTAELKTAAANEEETRRKTAHKIRSAWVTIKKEAERKKIVGYCKEAADLYNNEEYKKALDLFNKALTKAVTCVSEDELKHIMEMIRKTVKELAKTRKAEREKAQKR